MELIVIPLPANSLSSNTFPLNNMIPHPQELKFLVTLTYSGHTCT